MREILEKTGREIDYELLFKISEMQQKAFPEELHSLQYRCNPSRFAEAYHSSLEKIHIVYGEDWYFLYQVLNPFEIWFYELVRVQAPKGEQNLQLLEMLKAFRKILETEKTISTTILEGTAYPLYLIWKKRKWIEQIGLDFRFSWKYSFIPSMICSSRKQERILTKALRKQNRKQNIMAHRVCFQISK